MPTTYAHYKLGKEVRKKVSDQASAIIEEFPQLFQLGLHGPDLLFYYKIINKNKINTLGHSLHKLSGEEYFKKAAEVIKENHYEKAHISYTLGFLCHFALDVTCHDWVNSQVAEGIADHLEIEAELDRELLLQDGRDPQTAILTGHMEVNSRNAKVISDFFEEVSKEEIEKAVSDMIFCLNLLVPKGPLKRGVLSGLLKLVGKYDDYRGLIINKEKNKNCEACTKRLLELFEDGKKLAIRLLDEYVDYLYGMKELDPIYQYNFDSILKEVTKG